jgi:hypothetical protein
MAFCLHTTKRTLLTADVSFNAEKLLFQINRDAKWSIERHAITHRIRDSEVGILA